MYCWRHPRGIVCLAGLTSRWLRAVHAASTFEVCGVGRVLTSDSTSFVTCSQLALRKFHLLAGFVSLGSIGLLGAIKEVRCWNLDLRRS